MEEDLPSCARSKRGAGFSHRGRWAPLSAPTPRPSRLLYTPLSKAVRKSCLCRGPGEGVASGRHQLKPADIHEPFEKRFGPHVESSPVRDLSTASAPRTPRGRALADSQDQRRLSNLATSRLVGSLKQTIDGVCTEPGKQDAEMPNRRRSARAVLLPLPGPHPRPHSIRAVLLPLPGPHPRPHSIRAVLLPLPGPHPHPHLSFHSVYV